jgi:ABC-type sugar transport system ATPase subunit
MTLAHRVAVMRKGKLQQFDSPMKIYEQPVNRFVAEFVGSPSMNFIDGEIDGDSFVSKDLSVNLNEEQVKLLSGHPGKRITLGVRPEHVDVGEQPHEGSLPASVYVTELMGNETLVFVTVGPNKIIARAAAGFRAELETKMWLRFATEQFHFFDSETGARVR